MQADDALAVLRQHLNAETFTVLPPYVARPMRRAMETLISRGVLEREELDAEDIRRTSGLGPGRAGPRFAYRISAGE